MERPPVTRPLPPATGRAAPPSALGKGRGPVGPPPPLASPPPLHSLYHPVSDPPPATTWVSGPALGTPRYCQVPAKSLSGRARLDSSFLSPGRVGESVHTILSHHLLHSFHCLLSFSVSTCPPHSSIPAPSSLPGSWREEEAAGHRCIRLR